MKRCFDLFILRQIYQAGQYRDILGIENINKYKSLSNPKIIIDQIIRTIRRDLL
jgi:hypothetical protein